MAALPHAPSISPEQYLEQEYMADCRSEYWNGEIVAMAGGSPAHNRILRNLTRRLGNQLDGRPCQPFSSETRVRVPQYNAYFYPDALIVCGDLQREEGPTETLLNPSVIFEVLSALTEAVDRGRKFACYRSLPALQCYVLVRQDAPEIDLYTRQAEDRWLLTPLTGLEATLVLDSVGVSLPFSEIYQEIVFTPQSDLPILRR